MRKNEVELRRTVQNLATEEKIPALSGSIFLGAMAISHRLRMDLMVDQIISSRRWCGQVLLFRSWRCSLASRRQMPGPSASPQNAKPLYLVRRVKDCHLWENTKLRPLL